jgi:hypothetical protein
MNNNLDNLLAEFKKSADFSDQTKVDALTDGEIDMKASSDDIMYKHCLLFYKILTETQNNVLFFFINMCPDGSIDYNWNVTLTNQHTLLINIDGTDVSWYGAKLVAPQNYQNEYKGNTINGDSIDDLVAWIKINLVN